MSTEVEHRVFEGHCRNCKTKVQLTVTTNDPQAAEKAAKSANCIKCGNRTGMVLGLEIVKKKPTKKNEKLAVKEKKKPTKKNEKLAVKEKKKETPKEKIPHFPQN